MQRPLDISPKKAPLVAEISASAEPVAEVAPGLRVLADGLNPTVDIVAVHGLNGHREKTWTTRAGVNWLRDFLPHNLPNARILSWDYDANTHTGFRVSCQYLFNHARTLVSDLCLKRQITQTSKRPIIFVAHSLGGIIVKSALIHSDAARREAAEEHLIKLSTYGIMFMGTPHQGSSGVTFGKLMVNIALVYGAVDDSLLQNLEHDSEWLQQQLGQYGSISGDFVTKFAFEKYATQTGFEKSVMVVPEASAVVPGAADSESIAIHADHINMVRFSSNLDHGYKIVSGQLREMTENACNTNTGRGNVQSGVSVVPRLSSVSPRIPASNETAPRDKESKLFSPRISGGNQTAPTSKESKLSRGVIKTAQYTAGLEPVRVNPRGESHSSTVTAMAFSPDGQLVASASSDNTVRLWRVTTGACRNTLEGHSNEVTAVAFSPDGQLVASASWDATVRLWEVATGTCRNTLKDHSDGVTAVAFSPDGQLVASASWGTTVSLWEVATGTCRKSLKGHSDGVIMAVAFSPDGQLVASASWGTTVRLWEVATGRCRSTLKGHSEQVTAVAFSPNGQLIASASHDKTVRLWRVTTRACYSTLEGHSKIVTAVAFSPDGRLIASASHDKTVRLWETTTGMYCSTLEGPSGVEKENTSNDDLDNPEQQEQQVYGIETIRDNSTIPYRQRRRDGMSDPLDLPETIQDNLEYCEVYGSGPVWTYTWSENVCSEDIPLRISGHPVVMPVDYRHPAAAYTIPPPDPRHLFIDASKDVSEDIVHDIFETYNDIVGFYLLINGMLQLIIPEDFDIENALSHKPNEFGGLKVSYIHQSIIPTVESQERTFSGSLQESFNLEAAASQHTRPSHSLHVSDNSTMRSEHGKSRDGSMDLKIGSMVHARLEGLKAADLSQGKIGLMTESNGQNHVVIPTHILTEALIATKSDRFPGDRWIDEMVVVASSGGQEIGYVTKTFDPLARRFPHGFEHDVSLVEIRKSRQLGAGIKSLLPTKWLSQNGWNKIRYTSQSLFLLDKPDLQTKNIELMTSQYQMVGQAIFKIIKPTEQKTRLRFLLKGKKSDSEPSADIWTGTVARSVLYRVNSSSMPPGALSGTAVCILGELEDGSSCADVAGFSSWAQPAAYSRFDMEGPKLYSRLEDGRVAFFGAFQAPPELREHHCIV